MELFRGIIDRNHCNQHEHHHSHNHQSNCSRRDSDHLAQSSGCAFDVQQVHTPSPVMEGEIGTTLSGHREALKPIFSKERWEERTDRLVFTLPL